MNPFKSIIPVGGKVIQNFGGIIAKKSPQILIGTTCIGVIATAVLAVTETPTALKIIEQKKPRDKVQTVQCCWKVYIPAVIAAGLTCTAAIMSHRISAKRITDLASLCVISEKALAEYQNKTQQKMGRKKEEMIRSDVMKDKMDNNPPSESSIVITGKGDVLCYDVLHDRYFYSNYEQLRKAQNDFNYRLRSEMWLTTGELYEMLGLKATPTDSILGWDVDTGMEMRLATCMSDDNRPCISMGFYTAPTTEKYKTW